MLYLRNLNIIISMDCDGYKSYLPLNYLAQISIAGKSYLFYKVVLF